MKYCLYVDEVGNSDLGSSSNPNHRYLSLTGVILELSYVKEFVFPSVEEIKHKYFKSHPDEPVILHRKEIVNKKPPFESLMDSDTENAFNVDLMNLLTNLDYQVITVVIDKEEHKSRYHVWRFDPYHYCLTILVERYVKWLHDKGSIGDVMAESRGGKEDRRLKDSFERIFNQGSDYIHAEVFQTCLTSCQLKVKPKSNNISGLQIADILAHPSYKALLSRHNNQNLPNNFGGKIATILENSKLLPSPTGQINGWGRKWLP